MEDFIKAIEQTEEAAEQQSPVSFATIGAVYTDGVTLIFDGTDEPTEKHYKCNTSVLFHAGDRVKLAADSGTYVVEYVVGVPAQPSEEVHGIPSGGRIGQVLRKSSNYDYAATWQDARELPTGGTSGQVLKKTGSGDDAVEWGAAPTPTVDTLTSGYNTVKLSGTTLQGAGINLGSSSTKFTALYLSGAANIAGNFACNGMTPQGKQYLGSSATLSDVIAVLRKFGFVS